MSLNAIGELMTVLGLAGLLFGEWKDRPVARAVGKPFASLGFIVAAIGFGALESRYGHIVLIGLILGAIGDVCLLGQAKQYFIEYSALIPLLQRQVLCVDTTASTPSTLR